jgi:membrane protease YdiL (CAAX protease family)
VKYLKAVGQVVGYLATAMVIVAALVIPTRFFFGDSDSVDQKLQILIFGIHFVVGVAITNVLAARIGKSTLVKAGWLNVRSSVKWFGTGALIGLGTASGMLVLTMILGGGRLTYGNGGLSEYLAAVIPLVGYLLIAALGEEWIFRGYPLIRFSQVFGRGGANVLLALLFMGGHWGGSGWNTLVAVNIFVFSLVNGACRFTTGGIPAAWGFHFAWNSLQVMLGATLTGEDFGIPMVRFVGEGPKWLSGGLYGPEGGIGTTVATTIGLLLIWRYLRRRKTTGS